MPFPCANVCVEIMVSAGRQSMNSLRAALAHKNMAPPQHLLCILEITRYLACESNINESESQRNQ